MDDQYKEIPEIEEIPEMVFWGENSQGYRLLRKDLKENSEGREYFLLYQDFERNIDSEKTLARKL